MHVRWKILCMAATLWIVSSTPAFAYIDPGTGSIIAQAAIGIVVAAGVFARSWWSRLLAFFQPRKTGPAAQSEEHD